MTSIIEFFLKKGFYFDIGILKKIITRNIEEDLFYIRLRFPYKGGEFKCETEPFDTLDKALIEAMNIYQEMTGEQ